MINLALETVGPPEQAIYKMFRKCALGRELGTDRMVGGNFSGGCCANNCGRPLL
jgi:hypothetical protein